MVSLRELETATAKLIDVLEEQNRAAEFEARVEAEVERRLAERAAQDERERVNGLRRSTMTPREKSAFIRARGKAAYDQLPWS